tara:strand:+ start:1522 stop:1791 length:270 start_codon:yes stop_codon:yes gene_type:complete
VRGVTDNDYRGKSGSSDLVEWKFTQLFTKIRDMEDHIKALESRAELRDRERAVTEQRYLKWGISTLGAIVATLAAVIWSYRSIIFRGLP